LNGLVTQEPDSTYGLARPLAVRLVGRSLVALGVLVAAATLLGSLAGNGWEVAAVVTLLGLVAVGARGWWLLRRAHAVRLTSEGYDVRLLGGVGVTAAAWADVSEVAATSPGGQRCLVLRLADGRATRLPVAVLAADPDVLALDVRRRVRDAHSRSEELETDAGDGPSDTDRG
jgi:hypothetical protein